MTAVRGRNLAAPVELPSRAAAGVGDVAGAAPALSRRVLWPAALGAGLVGLLLAVNAGGDRKSTRLNSSHGYISYAVFCLKKKKKKYKNRHTDDIMRK